MYAGDLIFGGIRNAQNESRIFLYKCSIIFRQISWGIVACHQYSEGVATNLSSQFHGENRVYDATGVNGCDLSVEDVDPFEKKWPLLRKENRKALVGIHHQLICFDLREVGFDCEIQRDVRRDAVLTGQTGFELDWCVDEAAGIKE